MSQKLLKLKVLSKIYFKSWDLWIKTLKYVSLWGQKNTLLLVQHLQHRRKIDVWTYLFSQTLNVDPSLLPHTRTKGFTDYLLWIYDLVYMENLTDNLLFTNSGWNMEDSMCYMNAPLCVKTVNLKQKNKKIFNPPCECVWSSGIKKQQHYLP